MAYTYYAVKVEFEDGNSGFIQLRSSGGYGITDDLSDCLVFDTRTEAEDFYYDVIGKDATVNGSRISRVSISTLSSERPL